MENRLISKRDAGKNNSTYVAHLKRLQSSLIPTSKMHPENESSPNKTGV